MNDFRVVNINGNIYCYDSVISAIFNVKIINNKIYIPLNLDDDIYEKEFFYFKKNLCSDIDENTAISPEYTSFEKKYDKNWSLITIAKIDNELYFEFINWFKDGYVINTFINMKTGNCYNKNVLKMGGDIIDGLGTATMPLFSLGTPFLKLENDNPGVDFYGICAGHTKIILTKKYENSNIQKFLIEKNNTLGKLNNYIEHNSYIYMCYFIKLTKYKNNNYDIFISDSYLFIDKSKKYVFSICFPMGLIEKEHICMTYGYGDYYNCLLEIDKKKLLGDIKHNLKDLNENNYNFHIIMM